MSVAAERAVETPVRAAPSAKPRRYDRPRTLWVVTGLVYLFLFAPIVVVILFSFNSARSLQTFEGFSLRWYEEFFGDESLRQSLFTSWITTRSSSTGSSGSSPTIRTAERNCGAAAARPTR